MGTLLSFPAGLPSKLPAASADSVPRDGADCFPGGGRVSLGGEKCAADEFAVAGPLLGGGDLRAGLTQRHRASGSAPGPAVREIVSASGESPAGTTSATRT